MNPLWILAFLAMSKKKTSPPSNPGNPGNPGTPVGDDPLDRL